MNPNGQTTSSNSAPVVIASDQSHVPIFANDSSGNAITAASAPVGNETTLLTYPLAQSIKKASYTIHTSGDNTIYTPASGKAVKLLWASYTSDAGNLSATKVILKNGATALDTQSLSASQPFAHTIGGGRGFYDFGANNPVIVNLSIGNTVYVNLEWLEY